MHGLMTVRSGNGSCGRQMGADMAGGCEQLWVVVRRRHISGVKA